MDYALWIKMLAELFGTAILIIFGNGAVANTSLKGTSGHGAGWLNIAMGYGIGVMLPVAMFGSVSGAHINPAMTIGQAAAGIFPWSNVLPYIVAQLIGAALGQLVVWGSYKPFYDKEEDAGAIFGSFATGAVASRTSYFFNEFAGTFVLVFGALCALSFDWGAKNPMSAAIVAGFIVWGLVVALGGPGGPALNPARDLMPRLVHAILPIAHKGGSRWEEAWIPVVAPICGAIFGALLYTIF